MRAWQNPAAVDVLFLTTVLPAGVRSGGEVVHRASSMPSQPRVMTPAWLGTGVPTTARPLTAASTAWEAADREFQYPSALVGVDGTRAGHTDSLLGSEVPLARLSEDG